MDTQVTQRPIQDVVERNTRRIDLLVREVEKLIGLFESQRLVEPTVIVQFRQELHAIQRGE